MTSINNEKKKDLKDAIIDENFYFDLDQDLTLTIEEAKRLEKNFKNFNLDPQTVEFFKSSRVFYEKLKKNDYRFSLD